MPANSHGVPDLGHVGRVLVVEHRILTPASCRIIGGGYGVDGTTVSMEVVDIPKGTRYVVPLSSFQLNELRKELLP